MLSKLGLLLKLLILLPILIAVVLLAVANDQTVTLHLNPFAVDDPVLRLDLPLYQLGFALFVLGAVVGGLVNWASQRKHHRRTRHRRDEAQAWQSRPESPSRDNGSAQDRGSPSRAVAFLPRPERG